MAASSEVQTADTPEQQAALQDLTNGWTRQRLIECIALGGTIEAGAKAAGINPSTAHKWAAENPEYAAEVARAKRRAGEKVFSRLVTASLNADDDQILKHPTAPIMVVNSLLPEYRPNPAPAVAIQVNVTVDDFAQALKTFREVPESEPSVIDGDPERVDGSTGLSPRSDVASDVA